MEFVSVLTVRSADKARVIVAALKAHGFHPLDGGTDGLPGMPGVTGLGGIDIKVPENEAEDARVLAEALRGDLEGDPKD